MFQSSNGDAPDRFDVLCDRLEAISATDVPDRSCSFALVFGDSGIEWYPTFAEAARNGRERFEPESYAIGDPTAQPEYVPMVFVRAPIAD